MAAVLHLPEGPAWTLADLDALPEDGLQYELVDGTLLVTPAPLPDHQRASRALFRLLDPAAPPGVEVFFAPLDFRPTAERSLQPDVLVVDSDEVGPANVQGRLLLAVEVLSRSTRSKDLVLKRHVYEESAVDAYWVLDREVPSVTVWERAADGGFGPARVVTGDEELPVDRPFPLVLRPAALAAG